MKSIKILAMASAVALLGTAGLTSCKDKNSPEIDPGTGDYKGEVVKTEFVINITDNAAGNAADRWNMPASTAQIDVESNGLRDNFRGMDSIRLVPYGADFSARIGKTIKLTPIAKGTTGLPNKSSSKYYTNVAIPLGTENFLFYGKAGDATVGSLITTPEQKFQYGYLGMTGLWEGNVEKEGISFSPSPIYTYNGTPDAKATALVTYLTNIANDTHWASITNNGILDLHAKLLDLKSGSSNAVQAVVEDLYNSLERYNGLQVSPDDNVTAIMATIGTKADGCSTTGTAGHRTLTLVSALAGYPQNIYLPDGAAKIQWNDSDPTDKHFEVVNSSNIGTNLVTDLSSYVYPANLQYFAKSGIKTSNQSQKSAYESSTNWWKDILNLYTAGGVVKASTRSVAIEDTIQYGVGQLKTTVKLSSTSLKDNATPEVTISIPTGGLKWSGLLIGDQKAVDYEFEQTNNSAVAYTIYDNYLNTTTGINQSIDLTDSESVPNYTLVLPTKDNGTKAHKVYVAIELINNAEDFIGVSGELIPKGGKFYLIGALDASASTTSGTNPSDWNIFYKDYVTEAHFTITSLKNAYYTIPDLRSSDLELGFSVDLAWKSGLVFNVEL